MFDDKRFDDKRAASGDDDRADRALYVGLRDLPTPSPSSDFDARILSALAPRPPFWQTVWRVAVRPALPAALCTLIGMLLLLRQAQQTPVGAPSPPPAAIARATARQRPQAEAWRGETGKSLPETLDNIDLNSAALSFLSHPIRRTPGKRG